MMNIVHIIWKGVRRLILLYFLFALIGSTVPWLPFVKPVPGEHMQDTTFFGDGEGSDGVLLIETPHDAFNVRLEMVRAATQSLDIVYYSISPDACGQAFLREVRLAADRGVQVRILVDAKFNGGKTRHLLEQLQAHENITCREYNPLHLLKPWTWHATLHDKFILVDETYLLLGGRNIGNRFYNPAEFTGEVTQDRDVFVANTQPGGSSVCQEAAAYMDMLFRTETTPHKTRDGGKATWDAQDAAAASFASENPAFYARSFADYLAALQPTRKVTLISNPIHTQKKVPAVAETMRDLAMTASGSVVMQTPYATASKTLMQTLHAIDANADTTLLTNSLASSPNYFAYSNYYSQRQHFLDAGLDIYELQTEDSIHGKSMIVDGCLSAVGSFNMDDRSFYIDTESMLVIDSEPFAQTLHGAVQHYIDQSLLVGTDNHYLPSEAVTALPATLPKRVMMMTVSIFSRIFSFLI